MAAAEARAAWQRMANRCFVQEDAKRAPKLACCPPSSSKLQYDPSNGETVNGPDHLAPNFMPLNWNPMNSNLPPDTKWWLQLQPNFGNQKDFTCEQVSAFDEELEDKSGENVAPASKITGDSLPVGNTDVDIEKNATSLEAPRRVSTTFMRYDSESQVEELKAFNNNSQQPIKRKADVADHWYEDEELMDWKAVDRLISKKPENACFDMETPCIGGEKTEPWWLVADKDELASFVAQKSLEHFENCDLPRPQKMHICRDPFGYLDGFDDHGIFSSSLDQKLHTGICNPFEAQRSSTSGSIDRKHWTSGEVGQSVYNSEKLYRNTAAVKDPPETKLTPESDANKSELLEALRRSQTRARKAEMAAQQAYNEKEHTVKLLFKQASHLFAYKQWLRMLQLESLCLQLKIKEHQISTLFPVLPWMPFKDNQYRNSEHKATKRKGGKHKKCAFCRYAVAFAVGLGLASAGLLLGWTLGWLLPPTF